MTTAVAGPFEEARAVPGESATRQLWGRLRRKRLAMIALVVIALIYGAGILAPVISPYSYTEQALERQREGPSADHWLGTDILGRDLMTRAFYSSRTNLIVTVAVVLSGSLLIGNTLGLLSGYLGGRVDGAIMRIGDVFASLPGLPMLILVNAAFAPKVISTVRWIEDRTFLDGLVSSGFASYITVFAALSLFSWVGTARLIRAQVLQLRERDYILAAQAVGASTPRIMLRHLLPNVSHLIILQVSTGLGAIAGSEVFLSWFGVGVQPPAASFGQMLFEAGGARTFAEHPHLLIVPAVFVTGLMFSFSLLGDALNDAMRGR